MIDPVALAEGEAHFNHQEYFEAHEVWEDAWRPLPKGDDKLFLQGLIQVAVSLEHWRRGNPRGAAGQWQKGGDKLRALPTPYAGIDLALLLGEVGRFYTEGGTGPWPGLPRAR